MNREVTARDVAYGIARGFLPGVDSPAARLYFSDVEGVADVAAGRRTLPSGLRTPDDNTLEIRLRAPTGRLVAEALTLPLAAPVPQEYAAPFDRQPHSSYGRHQVFTGPYRIAGDRPACCRRPTPRGSRWSAIRAGTRTRTSSRRSSTGSCSTSARPDRRRSPTACSPTRER